MVGSSASVVKAANEYFDTLVKSRFIEMFGKYFNSNEIVLADLCTSIDSGKSYTCGDPRTEVEPAILKLGAVFGGEYNPNENKVVDPDLFKEEFEVKPGDVLFSRKNTYVLVGTAAYVWDTPPKLMLPDLIFRINLNDSVNPIYFVKLINHPLYRVRVTSLAHGAASSMPNISKKELLGLGVPLPPITEQNLFADFVRQVDKSKLLFQQMVSKYDKLVKSRFIEMFGDLQTVQHQKLTEVCVQLGRGKTPKYVEESDCYIIGQACIRWDEIQFDRVRCLDQSKYKQEYELKSGDILFNSTGVGSLGRCCVFINPDKRCYVTDSHVTIIRLISNTINPVFLHHYLSLDHIQTEIYARCVNGSTNQIELNAASFANFDVPVPEISKQNQFADFVRQVDKSKSEILEGIKRLKLQQIAEQ